MSSDEISKCRRLMCSTDLFFCNGRGSVNAINSNPSTPCLPCVYILHLHFPKSDVLTPCCFSGGYALPIPSSYRGLRAGMIVSRSLPIWKFGIASAGWASIV